MSTSRLQVTRSIYKNQLHFYKTAVNTWKTRLKIVSFTSVKKKRERERKLWRKGVGQANESNLTASFNSLVAALCAQD